MRHGFHPLPTGGETTPEATFTEAHHRAIEEACEALWNRDVASTRDRNDPVYLKGSALLRAHNAVHALERETASLRQQLAEAQTRGHDMASHAGEQEARAEHAESQLAEARAAARYWSDSAGNHAASADDAEHARLATESTLRSIREGVEGLHHIQTYNPPPTPPTQWVRRADVLRLIPSTDGAANGDV